MAMNAIGQNLQPFTGNGDVSIWVKHSQVGSYQWLIFCKKAYGTRTRPICIPNWMLYADTQKLVIKNNMKCPQDWLSVACIIRN